MQSHRKGAVSHAASPRHKTQFTAVSSPGVAEGQVAMFECSRGMDTAGSQRTAGLPQELLCLTS